MRVALENTKSIDAGIVGGGITAMWNNLSLTQQHQIRSHAFLMRKKKYSVKPHMMNYFGALVGAVNIEKVEPAKLSQFLSIAEKVINLEVPGKANTFFANARVFFTEHALHDERSFKLVVSDYDYTFDYIESAPLLSWDDTTQVAEEPAIDETISESTGASEDTVSQMGDEEVMPIWMTPAPMPILSGAVIKFRKVSLGFITPYDSVSLRNTKGTLSLSDNLFVGNGGRFDWSAAGLSPDSVYCEMKEYSFNITKPEIKSDLVKLNYVGRTPGMIPGNFEFKSVYRKDGAPATYPRFKSYQSNMELTGVGDANVKYIGGFSLTGKQVSGGSVNNDPSLIEVYNKGEKKIVARSTNFVFSPGNIASEKASVAIFHDSDSIFHQAVRMRYIFGDSIQKLAIQKDKGDMRNAPYSSTYFNIDFATDRLEWNLNADSLNLRTDGGRNTVPLIIESVDYYDPEDYRLLRGEGFDFHPLAMVVSYSLRSGLSQFYSSDLVTASNRDANVIKRAVQFLLQKGMINYDPKTDQITVKQKAVDIWRSFKGEEDYDNLKIHSVIDSTDNATINFSKGYMTVRGVEEFDLSDSLNVHITPDSSVITVLRNRDIKFDGTIDAGNFQISGKGFTLRYDSFLIDLQQIDSVNFYVTEKNARGQEIRRKINNSMVGQDSTSAAAGGIQQNAQKSGTLFISRADNKSGKERIPNYPRLDASSGGVIYFDRKEVLNGVYDRSIFFVVPPFKLDSLNDADPASINFDGTFVSSGIFPSFKEKLHTQPDKSLGFDHAIPKGGYQLYKGDGKMNGTISMDSRGLRGVGKIDFLAATIASADFIYYPDSVIARGDRAIISKKQFGPVIFPDASLPDYEMKWIPKEDRMVLKNRKTPFNFYDSTAQLQGKITISKNGVAGEGRFLTRGTELVSQNMRFTGDDFSARHGRFKVRSADPDKPLFTGNDVRLKFNLQENYADLSPEVEGVAAIDFPYAQVRTSIQKARWDLDEQKIVMSKDPSVDIENSYFYTTRKELDSLHFNAAGAEYNLKTQELKVSGIPYIVVADAQITPENNEVLILENARIGTLKNTTIVLDTLNAYHRLTEGVVDIVSRKEFSGYATYQYVNHLNDTFAIKMTDFHLEPIEDTESSRRNRKNLIASMQTVATGAVSEQEKIVLGAGLYYKGDMIMYATRPALKLDGFVKLDIRNIKDYNAWIKYQQTGEETDVHLDFDNAVTEDGRKANAGLHFGATDHQLYITFMNDKKSEDDDDFFIPAGSLVYDKEHNEYRIENLEKAAGNRLEGKILAYNDEKQAVKFEGQVQLLSGTKDFNVTASANGNASLATSEMKMNALVMVDCNVPPTAFEVMGRHLVDIIKNEGANEGLGDHTELLYKVADLVGERFAKDYEQKSQQGYVSLSTIPALVKPMVFADVNLKLHAKSGSLYSEGLLGVSHVGKIDVNGGFEGFMEVGKSEDGAPVFHVFFKASPEAWYYFGFEDNKLMIHSSNGEFNDIITKKTNAGKAKVGELVFIPGSDDETLAFINKFRKLYYGIDVPYSLNEGTQAVEKKKTDKKKEEDDGF